MDEFTVIVIPVAVLNVLQFICHAIFDDQAITV